MSGRERLHYAVHMAAPVLIFLIGFSVVPAMREARPDVCYEGNPALPNLVIIGSAGVGLFLGRWFSHLKGQRAASAADHPRADRGATYLGWAILLFLWTVGWYYEALGMTHTWRSEADLVSYQPITYLLRCAAYVDIASHGPLAPVTSLVVGYVSFLVGHWLWSDRPEGKRRPRPPVVRAAS